MEETRNSIGQLLLRAERWVEAALRERLRALGWVEVSRPHAAVFANLNAKGTRPSEIARRAGVTRQAIHQTVDELVDLGLVELVSDPTNRRARLVRLTRRGRTLDAAARRGLEELEDDLADRIGAANLKALRRALELDWGDPEGVEEKGTDAAR